MNSIDELILRFTLSAAHMLWVGASVWLLMFLGERLVMRTSAGRHALHLVGLLVLLLAFPVLILITNPRESAPDGVNPPERVVQTAKETKAEETVVAVNDLVVPIPAESETAKTIDPVNPSSEVSGIIKDTAAKRADENSADKPTKEWFWLTLGPWVSAAYGMGLLVMSLRLILGWVGSARLRKRGEPITSGVWWDALHVTRERVRIRGEVLMAWSREVAAPVVMGFVKPAILLPLSLATRLSPAQIEAVLVHELAHLRRGDNWAIIVQRIAETLLFFHPAVWWMSHRMDSLREEACDDLVLAAGCDPADYAEALVICSECRLEHSGLSARLAERLAATGKEGSPLRRRILRLLGQTEQGSVRLGRAGWLFGLLAILGMVSVMAFGGAKLGSHQEVLNKESTKQLKSALSKLRDDWDSTRETKPNHREGQQAYCVVDTKRRLIQVVREGAQIPSLQSVQLPPAYDYTIDYWSLVEDRLKPQRELESPVVLRLNDPGVPNFYERLTIVGQHPRDSFTISLTPNGWGYGSNSGNSDGYQVPSGRHNDTGARSMLVEGEERDKVLQLWNDRHPTVSIELGQSDSANNVSEQDKQKRDAKRFHGFELDPDLEMMSDKAHQGMPIFHVENPDAPSDSRISYTLNPIYSDSGGSVLYEPNKSVFFILTHEPKSTHNLNHGPYKGNPLKLMDLPEQGLTEFGKTLVKLARIYPENPEAAKEEIRVACAERLNTLPPAHRLSAIAQSIDHARLQLVQYICAEDLGLALVAVGGEEQVSPGSSHNDLLWDCRLKKEKGRWTVTQVDQVPTAHRYEEILKEYRKQHPDTWSGSGQLPDLVERRLQKTLHEDYRKLLGYWEVVSVKSSGSEGTNEVEGSTFKVGSLMSIRGWRTMVGSIGKQEYVVNSSGFSPLSCDPHSDPKGITFVSNNKRGVMVFRRGIYRFEDNGDLSICQRIRQSSTSMMAENTPNNFDLAAEQSEILVRFRKKASSDQVVDPGNIDASKVVPDANGANEASSGATLRIVDSQGKAIPNARVRLDRGKNVEKNGKLKWEHVPAWEGTTGATGEVPIPASERKGELDRLLVRVEADGFVSRWFNHNREILSRADGVWEDQRYVLLKGAVLSGRVLDAEGKPLAGAPLSVSTFCDYDKHWQAGGDAPAGVNEVVGNHLRAVTDKDGRFRIDGVPPGGAVIHYPWEGPSGDEVREGKWKKWTKPGQDYPKPSVADRAWAKPLALREGDEIKDLIADLSKSTAAIDGTVVDEAGSPVPDASVWVTWKAEGLSGVSLPSSFVGGHAVTGADGKFRLHGLPSGSVVLKVSHADLVAPKEMASIELSPDKVSLAYVKFTGVYTRKDGGKVGEAEYNKAIRETFLKVERFARLQMEEQTRRFGAFYQELDPQVINGAVEMLLSNNPHDILDWKNDRRFGSSGGNTRIWERQLADASSRMTAEQVADKLDDVLYLRIAARARALKVLEDHRDEVIGKITRDLGSDEESTYRRATMLIHEMRLRQFGPQLEEIAKLGGKRGEDAKLIRRNLWNTDSREMLELSIAGASVTEDQALALTFRIRNRGNRPIWVTRPVSNGPVGGILLLDQNGQQRGESPFRLLDGQSSALSTGQQLQPGASAIWKGYALTIPDGNPEKAVDVAAVPYRLNFELATYTGDTAEKISNRYVVVTAEALQLSVDASGEFVRDSIIEPVRADEADALKAENPAQVGAQAPLSATSMLEFHIAPRIDDLRDVEIVHYRKQLGEGMVGRWWLGGIFEGPLPSYFWLPLTQNVGVDAKWVTGEYKGKKYLLVSDKPGEAVNALPPRGKTDANWGGVIKVTATRDGNGLPAVGFELNERGGEQISALTEANLNRALAFVIAGKVVSVPVITSAMGRNGMINGKFSEQEVSEMVKAIQENLGKLDDNAESEDGKDVTPASCKLEFRVAPNAKDLKESELETYREWLGMGRLGPWWLNENERWTGPLPSYQWLPMDEKSDGAGQLVIGEYKGRKFLLVSDKPGEAMNALPPREKTDTNWGGVIKVALTRDSNGQPAVGFELNERGGEQLAALTQANLNRELAFVIDGKVVSVPIIKSTMGKNGMITGRSSEKEVDDMVKTIRGGFSHGDGNPPISRLIISKERGGQITQDGVIYSLDGELVAIEKLQERFQQMVKERPDLQVVVHANDPELPAGSVIAAIQAARAAGAKHVDAAEVDAAVGPENPKLPNGIYRVRPFDSDLQGVEMSRSDANGKVVLLDRLTENFGKVSMVSISNDNTRLRLDLVSAGPFKPGDDIGHFAIVIDALCIVCGGHSDLNGEKKMDLSGWVVGRDASARLASGLGVTPRLRKDPGHKMETRFSPSKNSFVSGESVILKMEIKNVGDAPFSFRDGGLQRGARNNQFGFKAFRNNGRGAEIPDSGDPANFGGKSTLRTLKPGEVFAKEVDITKWFDLSKPDTYKIEGSFLMEIFRKADFSYAADWDDIATGTTKVVIEPGSDGHESSARENNAANICRLIIAKERGGQISPGGVNYSVDHEWVAIEKLQERFQQMVSPDLQVIIYATDPELPAGTAITAIQTARAAGVKHIRVGTGEPLGSESTDPARGANGVVIKLDSVKHGVAAKGKERPLLDLEYSAINRGDRMLHLPENGVRHQVEVDGKWYEWVHPRSSLGNDGGLRGEGFVPEVEATRQSAEGDAAKTGVGNRLLEFGPGATFQKLNIPVAGRWLEIPKGKEHDYALKRNGGSFGLVSREDYGDELNLKPGNHKVRVAVICPSARASQGHELTRSISDLVEFLVSDPAATGTREASAAERKVIEAQLAALKVRLEALRQTKTDQHPDVRVLLTEIAELEKSLVKTNTESVKEEEGGNAEGAKDESSIKPDQLRSDAEKNFMDTDLPWKKLKSNSVQLALLDEWRNVNAEVQAHPDDKVLIAKLAALTGKVRATNAAEAWVAELFHHGKVRNDHTGKLLPDVAQRKIKSSLWLFSRPGLDHFWVQASPLDSRFECWFGPFAENQDTANDHGTESFNGLAHENKPAMPSDKIAMLHEVLVTDLTIKEIGQTILVSSRSEKYLQKFDDPIPPAMIVKEGELTHFTGELGEIAADAIWIRAILRGRVDAYKWIGIPVKDIRMIKIGGRENLKEGADIQKDTANDISKTHPQVLAESAFVTKEGDYSFGNGSRELKISVEKDFVTFQVKFLGAKGYRTSAKAMRLTEGSADWFAYVDGDQVWLYNGENHFVVVRKGVVKADSGEITTTDVRALDKALLGEVPEIVQRRIPDLVRKIEQGDGGDGKPATAPEAVLRELSYDSLRQNGMGQPIRITTTWTEAGGVNFSNVPPFVTWQEGKAVFSGWIHNSGLRNDSVTLVADAELVNKPVSEIDVTKIIEIPRTAIVRIMKEDGGKAAASKDQSSNKLHPLTEEIIPLREVLASDLTIKDIGKTILVGSRSDKYLQKTEDPIPPAMILKQGELTHFTGELGEITADAIWVRAPMRGRVDAFKWIGIPVKDIRMIKIGGRENSVANATPLRLSVRPGKVDEKGFLSLVFEVKNVGAEALRVVRPVINGPGVGVLQFDKNGHQRGEPPFQFLDGISARLAREETMKPGELATWEGYGLVPIARGIGVGGPEVPGDYRLKFELVTYYTVSKDAEPTARMFLVSDNTLELSVDRDLKIVPQSIKVDSGMNTKTNAPGAAIQPAAKLLGFVSNPPDLEKSISSDKFGVKFKLPASWEEDIGRQPQLPYELSYRSPQSFHKSGIPMAGLTVSYLEAETIEKSEIDLAGPGLSSSRPDQPLLSPGKSYLGMVEIAGQSQTVLAFKQPEKSDVSFSLRPYLFTSFTDGKRRCFIRMDLAVSEEPRDYFPLFKAICSTLETFQAVPDAKEPVQIHLTPGERGNVLLNMKAVEQGWKWYRGWEGERISIDGIIYQCAPAGFAGTGAIPDHEEAYSPFSKAWKTLDGTPAHHERDGKFRIRLGLGFVNGDNLKEAQRIWSDEVVISVGAEQDAKASDKPADSKR